MYMYVYIYIENYVYNTIKFQRLFMSLHPTQQHLRPKNRYVTGVPFQPTGWHKAQVKPLALDTGFPNPYAPWCWHLYEHLPHK